MQDKTCGFCGMTIHLANFHVDISNPSGYCHICTGCAVSFGACKHAIKRGHKMKFLYYFFQLQLLRCRNHQLKAQRARLLKKRDALLNASQ